MIGNRNLAASIRARLKNKAKATGVEFQNLLIRFGNERFLYRISQSAYKDAFLLKGAALFAVWLGEPHRPTKDMDLLAFGNNDFPALQEIFREISKVDGSDGLEFSGESIKGTEIRAEQIYKGVRITMLAFLDGAKIPLQIDVGFGDAVTPAAKTVVIEPLIDLPKTKLRIYPKETVIAEKFEAMVKLGMVNSRMKDFWDVHFLIRNFSFEGEMIQAAIQATFSTRKTVFPQTTPLAFTTVFFENPHVVADWKAFIKRSNISTDTDLASVIHSLKVFFIPIIEAETNKTKFAQNWTIQNGWLR